MTERIIIIQRRKIIYVLPTPLEMLMATGFPYLVRFMGDRREHGYVVGNDRRQK